MADHLRLIPIVILALALLPSFSHATEPFPEIANNNAAPATVENHPTTHPSETTSRAPIPNCDAKHAGLVMWSGTSFIGCNESKWVPIGGVASCYVDTTGHCETGYYATGGTCAQVCGALSGRGAHAANCTTPMGNPILTGTTPTGWDCPVAGIFPTPTGHVICCK